MTQSAHTAFANGPARWDRECLLSVLVPFHNVDPHPLLRGLLRCCRQVAAPVEIIAADDGSDSRACLKRILNLMGSTTVPCRLLVLPCNRGRAAVRNALCRTAAGRFLLYLDGDVEVPDSKFLDNYLTLIESRAPDVAVGGFCMGTPARPDRRFRLQQYVSRRLHCAPLPVRSRHPGKYAYASNLLVRRALILEQGFDERFRGWGWEDVDLGFRLAERSEIVHVDNPVVHTGFQSSQSLVARWEQSVHNFRLLCSAHPQQAAELHIYQASVLLAKLPGVSVLRYLLKLIVLSDSRLVPLVIRYWSCRLLCAAIYAQAALPGEVKVDGHVLPEAG